MLLHYVNINNRLLSRSYIDYLKLCRRTQVFVLSFSFTAIAFALSLNCLRIGDSFQSQFHTIFMTGYMRGGAQVGSSPVPEWRL
jgi:hypothetical protein